MSLTRYDIRGKAYSSGKIPHFGFRRTADSIASDGIVDAAVFRDSAAGEGDFAAAWQYRPGLSDPNRVKRGSIVDGSKWTHEMDAYNDALTDLTYESVGWLHPDIVNDCIRLALKEIWMFYYWPLGWHVDNDFASSSVSTPHDWDTNKVNMTSVTKITTGNVYTQAGQTGPRNLVLAGNGTGNGYVPTSRLNVQPGDRLFHGAIGRVNTAGATGSYVLYDVTNSTALETITFTSRAFQRIAKETEIPSGCYQVEVRIGNVTASATTEWDCLFGHLLGDEFRTLTLPTWITRRHQFMSFGPANYGRQTATDTWNATSRQIESWYPNTHYTPLPLEADASVSILQIEASSGLTNTDFWLFAKRPQYDFETLDNETDVITADEDAVMPSVYKQLSQALILEYGESRWRELNDWAKGQVALQATVRSAKPPGPQRQYHSYVA